MISTGADSCSDSFSTGAGDGAGSGSGVDLHEAKKTAEIKLTAKTINLIFFIYPPFYFFKYYNKLE